MKTLLLPLLTAFLPAPAAEPSPIVSKPASPCVSPHVDTPSANDRKSMMSIYHYSAKAQDGSDVPLETYRGKVLLIVNTATRCGFTPQYKALQELYTLYHDKGFEILDFPCNQFGAQAPGTDEEINSFCSLRFGTTFPRFAKIEVNGSHAAPLYRYLTFADLAGMDPSTAAIAKRGDAHYYNNGKIKWNFTKFLIDRQGQVIARFEPAADMSAVRSAVEKAL